MSQISRFSAFLLLTLAASLVAPRANSPRADAAPPKEEKAAYAVVQVDDAYTVIRKADLKDFQKGLNDQYTKAVKEHQLARKEAIKNKEKFTTPLPKRPKIKALPKTFASEAEAAEFAQQLKREAEEKAKSEPAK